MTSAGKLSLLVWCAWLCSAWPIIAVCRADETEPSGNASEIDAADPNDVEVGELDWSVVADRTPIRAQEAELYNHLLDKAASTDVETLRREAEEFRQARWAIEGEPKGRPLDRFLSFVDVMLHPEVYRGVPVSLSGHTQDILVHTEESNPEGGRRYEAWLFTPGSQQIPTIVVFNELPEGLRPGSQLVDGVSVTGFFLKLYAYRAQDGKLHYAPLLIADRLEWNPPAAGMSLPNWIVGVGAAALAFVVLWNWWSSRGDRQFRRRQIEKDAEPVDLSGLSADS